MDQDLYQEQLLESARNPLNKGALESPDCQATKLNASCGDKVTVYLKFGQDGKVENIAWQGDGCIISQAAISLLSEEIKGKTPSEVEKLALADVLELLGMTEIVPGRIQCATLGLKAIKQAFC